MRGIVSAVTGAGKTTLALMCISEFRERHSDGRVLIIVPTVALADQWHVALTDDLGVSPTQVGSAGGGCKQWEGKPYVVAVINTARAVVQDISWGCPIMLVVDECHRAGSDKNARVLHGQYAATLGLSATPERQYDDGFEQHVRPALGDIILTYGYKDALVDGVLVPFKLINVRFPLLMSEQHAYNRLTRRIASISRHSDGSSEQLASVLRTRARISTYSPLRVPLAVKLAIRHRDQRVIIFHESIVHAGEIARILNDRGIRATLYHTGLDNVVRRANLRLYRNGYYTCMVCCRALDEGLNVPQTSVGIIAGSTSSTRQRIQRLGRVLRQTPGKLEALIYTLYATRAEGTRLAKEAHMLEGISEVVWQRVEVP